MNNNFWQILKDKKNPIWALAPMAGITDASFRRICAEYGADVVYSEMASATALNYAPDKTLELLGSRVFGYFQDLEKYQASQISQPFKTPQPPLSGGLRDEALSGGFIKDSPPDKGGWGVLNTSKKSSKTPYVAQLFGSDPKYFARATKIVTKEISPDGIDINFGCPVPKVAKQGAGAELMRDFVKSKEIIKATIANTDLPISIKVRTRAGEKKLLDFLDFISDLDIKCVMIHGRTLKQGFAGQIDTEIIKKAKNYFGGVILANGFWFEEFEVEKARDYYEDILTKTCADGIGVGRPVLGRPWIFAELKNNSPLDKGGWGVFDKNKENEIKELAIRHAEMMFDQKGEAGIAEMRKHLCWYVRGFKNATELRRRLVRVESLEDMKEGIAI